MPTFDEARNLILQNVSPLPFESTDLLGAVGRVLAEDVVSPWDLPYCNNSAMDGYAVRMEDCAGGAPLRLTGYVPAGGTPPGPLEPGCAIKIMTGAPLPAGCEAVLPLEHAEEVDGTVRAVAKITPKQNMRFAGEDVRKGEVAIPAGTLIRPGEINMLASCGVASVKVNRVPRVTILSTGDELTDIGEPLTPGKVVNSNSVSLGAAVKEAGGVPLLLGIARDNVEDHRAKMREGLKGDVFITSAGVSKGDRDFVRLVLAELGVREIFTGVKVRPGSPTAFFMHGATPVFCLPGNPVAALLMFDEFVRPALRKLMGYTKVFKPTVRAVLERDLNKKPGNVQLVRVRLEFGEGKPRAASAGNQNTAILSTMLKANGVAVLPAEATHFSPGDEIEVHSIAGGTELLQ